MIFSENSRKLIGELLVEHRLITEKDLSFAMHERHQNEQLFSALLRLGVLADDHHSWDVLAGQIGVLFARPGRDFEWNRDLIKFIDQETAKNHESLPLHDNGQTLKVGMTVPTNLDTIELLRISTGRRIQSLLISPEIFNTGMSVLYDDDSGVDGGIRMHADLLASLELQSPNRSDSGRKDIEEEVEGAGKKSHLHLEDGDGQDLAPAQLLLHQLLQKSIQLNASDIHVEPGREEAIVRFRIDGVLHEITRVSKERFVPFMTTVKVQSDMNIAERRLPQDGRFSTINKGVEVDFRVSTLPTIHGEKLVLRLLRRGTGMLRLDRLGIDKNTEKAMLRAIKNTSGIILLTGPTGSGKSTTLYSLLREVDTRRLNVITIEDPVEYHMPGITQVNIHPAIGLTFASVLRTSLRQDPDVIMVGEIRDQETAEIAIRAAQTGHLVLSTLHTNSASATLDRLLDMGIPPYLLAASLRFIGAQRLVRRNCSECMESYQPEQTALNMFPGFNFSDFNFKRGRGCPACNQSGYKGRMSLLEYLSVEGELIKMIATGVMSSRIKETGYKLGLYDTIERPGLLAVKNGVTTLEEMAKVLIHG
ncbi:MAG: GspE/PulE family protein [Pseudomonadota bacterium]